MRVIIRFSLNRDPGSALRNTLKGELETRGIMWSGRTTATYEGNIPEAEIRNALSAFWKAVANHPVATTKLNHFWMYTDRRPASIAEPED